MAKLKAPLLSLGAAGQLGKTLVFFGWKGLNVVREYVIPAYSRTTPQAEQRDYLKAAVADIHEAMALDAYPLNEADTKAYALWASVVQVATTWFNQAVRNFVDGNVLGKDGTIFRSGQAVEADTTLSVTVFSDEIDGTKITAGRFFWGTTKTALIHSGAGGIDAEAHSANLLIEGLTNGVKYFWQFRVSTGEDCEGARSGIYHNTPVAA
ncbi:hypothetical protein ES708_07996 [subsurface metagenome]